MPRLFLAVRPAIEVLDRIEALPRPAEPGVRWAPRGQWHVTVRFLGEAPIDEVTAALDDWSSSSSSSSSSSVGAVEADVGPRVSRLGRNIVCLPVGGLDELAASVGRVTAGMGEPPDPRPFRGHVTLGRLRNRGSCRLTGSPFAARFPVHEIELVRSTLSSAGAVHEVVARHAVPS